MIFQQMFLVNLERPRSLPNAQLNRVFVHKLSGIASFLLRGQERDRTFKNRNDILRG